MNDYIDEIVKFQTAEYIYIYGAGDVAREVGYCLMENPFNKKIKNFVVSELGREQNNEVLGISVASLDQIRDDVNALIIVAVLEKYKDEISNNIFDYGFRNVIFLTFESDLWSNVRGIWFEEHIKNTELAKIEYARKEGIGKIIDTNLIDDRLRIYVAKSHKDKSLKTDVPKSEWETDIQVGAALSDRKISDVTDDTGENISVKNASYCELTALYWIWKNTDTDYVGLSHYRRRFKLNEETVSYFIESDIDIVVTVPILNVPNVRYMYEKNHLEADWNKMEDAIKMLHPDYYDDFVQMSEGIIYFAYNMMIMNRKCLNEYCEWLFAILEYCEDQSLERDEYQKRYIGFLGERLLTVYILHHLKHYRIAYTDKCFYE